MAPRVAWVNGLRRGAHHGLVGQSGLARWQVQPTVNDPAIAVPAPSRRLAAAGAGRPTTLTVVGVNRSPSIPRLTAAID